MSSVLLVLNFVAFESRLMKQTYEMFGIAEGSSKCPEARDNYAERTEKGAKRLQGFWPRNIVSGVRKRYWGRDPTAFKPKNCVGFDFFPAEVDREAYQKSTPVSSLYFPTLRRRMLESVVSCADCSVFRVEHPEMRLNSVWNTKSCY